MGRGTAMLCSGAELRFVMLEDEMTLHLHMPDVNEGLPASIFFGCFQGGWDTSVKYLGPDRVSIRICKPKGLDTLKRVAQDHRQIFSP